MNRNSMFYNTVLMTLVSIVSQLLGFLYRIFLSRLIGAENMGLYQLILPVYSVIMSILAVGLTVSVSRLSAEFHALGNQRAIRQLLRMCLGHFIVLFSLLAAAVVFLYDPISVYLLGDARTQMGLLLLLPCILLTGIENLHKHYFYGTGNVRPAALIELAEQFIRFGAVISLLLLFLPQNNETTVGLIIVGMIICEVFSSVALVVLYRRKCAGEAMNAGPGILAVPLRRKVFGIALPIGMTSLLGNLMASANAILIPQRLIVAGMSASAAMSTFGILFGMTLPMLMIPYAFVGALCLMIVPKLSEAMAKSNLKECRQKIGRAMSATSVLVMPVMGFLITLGPTIGEFLFREATVGDHMVPLSIGVLLSCYQSVLGSGLNGIGKERIAAIHAILCGVVQLVFTFVGAGIPGVGIKGFIWGLVVSSLLGALLNGIQIMRHTKLRPKMFEWLVSPLLATILSGLCVNLLFQAAIAKGVNAFPAAGVCLLFGMVLYLLTLQVQGFRFRSFFRLR